ncbi:MAG: hypothetical protein LUI87_01500 [Lachnospiraceae bacterium]|nr:hypothetical protein [Lachnospiraceae bacterium]
MLQETLVIVSLALTVKLRGSHFLCGHVHQIIVNGKSLLSFTIGLPESGGIYSGFYRKEKILQVSEEGLRNTLQQKKACCEGAEQSVRSMKE